PAAGLLIRVPVSAWTATTQRMGELTRALAEHQAALPPSVGLLTPDGVVHPLAHTRLDALYQEYMHGHGVGDGGGGPLVAPPGLVQVELPEGLAHLDGMVYRTPAGMVVYGGHDQALLDAAAATPAAPGRFTVSAVASGGGRVWAVPGQVEVSAED